MKRKGLLFRTIVIALIVVLLAVCAFALYRYFEIKNQYDDINAAYDEIAESVVKETALSYAIATQETTMQTQGNEELTEPSLYAQEMVEVPITVDFEALQAMNPDIVGWIYCEGTHINYPILFGDSNQEYLYNLYDGGYSPGGSIFLDYRNAPDFFNENNIIYGHNMKNGSMFHDLVEFRSQEFLQEHASMYLFTPDTVYLLDIFTCNLTSIDDTLNLYGCYSDDAWYPKLEDILASSEASRYVEIQEDDRLVLLSTCEYDFNNARCIVMGKLIPLMNIE